MQVGAGVGSRMSRLMVGTGWWPQLLHRLAGMMLGTWGSIVYRVSFVRIACAGYSSMGEFNGEGAESVLIEIEGYKIVQSEESWKFH